MRKQILPAVFTAALATFSLPAAAAEGDLDLTDFPGAVVDDVVVPVASEVFAVLDKLGAPNWNEQLHKFEFPPIADRTRLALLLGSVVGEGFIAVQAEDREKVEEVGREVLRLAKALAVEEAVKSNAQAILDFAAEGDWTEIKKELDRTQKTVRDTMETNRDNELAQCVSIGGWIRGTEALTSIIDKAYNHDKAELLNQPFLVEHFAERIKAMSPEVRDHESVKSVAAGLEKIRAHIGAGDEIPDQTVVKDVHEICRGLNLEITSG